MSFWATLEGLTIQDVELFKKNCEKHGIDYQEVTDPNYKVNGLTCVATLRDTKTSRGHAYLVRKDGAIKVQWDNDVHYNTMNRLGQNGGQLTRDYAADRVRQLVQRSGGSVTRQEVHEDGSITLRCVAGGA